MNKEEVRRVLAQDPEIVRAWVEGKQIQMNFSSGPIPDWRNLGNPDWSAGKVRYRVKPEPREFYINIYADGRKFFHTSEKDALNAGRCSEPGDRAVTIKVREVVE